MCIIRYHVNKNKTGKNVMPSLSILFRIKFILNYITYRKSSVNLQWLKSTQQLSTAPEIRCSETGFK